MDFLLFPGKCLLAFAIGYLLGSIPFGFLLTKFAGGPDIRSIGSGNIGATNVLRTGNKKLAALTLLGDMLKGTAAVWIARHIFTGFDLLAPWYLAVLGAFLGHLFPVWLGYKGGKGVATYVGLLLGFTWKFALFFGLVWLGMALLFRYSSLAALVASAVTPIALWWFYGGWFLGLPFLVLTVLLWIMHRENIARLLNGTESKIGKKA